MLRIGLHVGMPTSRAVFSLHVETLARLFAYVMDGPEAVHCPGCLAGRLEWVTRTGWVALQRQPIARCYLVKYGARRMVSVVRSAELYFFAGQLGRALEAAGRGQERESVDDYIERMTALPEPAGEPTGEPVLH